MSRKSSAPAAGSNPMERTFAAGAGLFLALTLLKLVNPVVLDHRTAPPKDFLAAVTDSWPVAWGYMLLVLLIVGAALVTRFQSVAPKWVLWLPAVWLGWQCVAATRTVDAGLTGVVLGHFFAVAGCFCVGCFALGGLRRAGTAWTILLVGFVLMLAVGFQQRYGGLAQTLAYVEANEQNHWQGIPQAELDDLVRQEILIQTPAGYTTQPELLKRLRNSRVFGTFAGYPNALAGAILLLFPMLAVSGWRLAAGATHVVRGVSVGLLAYMTLACLYWSGSKGGLLIALGMGLVALLHLPLPKNIRYGLVAGALVVGVAGFALRFSGYFQKGATSVGARVSCWKAAVANTVEHPFLGSGPGTFARVYETKKSPEAEMSRLVHNDYLEQATDSGIIGFLSYTGWILGSILSLYRYRSIRSDGLLFAAWLGFTGWALQGGLEFSLYIPALAWPAFLLLGWLWAEAGARNQIDKDGQSG